MTAETATFTKHINSVLGGDRDLRKVLPIDPASSDLYSANADGLIMAKMINAAAEGTIDERALNKPKKSKQLNVYQMKENQQLVIQSAKAIGCIVVNVHPTSLVEGAPKQTLVRWSLLRRLTVTETYR